MKTILLILLALFAGAQLLVRLAPTDPEVWHTKFDVGDDAPQDVPFEGGFMAVRQVVGAPEDVLKRLDEIALATPRTVRIAGDVSEGVITYRTRSALWGFPDFTTVEANADGNGTRLAIQGRLRFGRSDLGVNRSRIEAWLSRL